MSNFLAPGSYSTISDLSQYAAPVSTTAVGVVGAARKGRILGKYDSVLKSYNTPELITTPEEFVRKYGTPSPSMQGPYAALLYLQAGRQLFYGRIASSNALTATLTVLDGDDADALVISALNEGAWGNNIGFTITDSAVTDRKTLTVYELVSGEAIVREQYDQLSIDPDDENYFDTVVNARSEFIRVTYETDSGELPVNVSTVDYLEDGSDGSALVDADVIGTESSGYATGLQAFKDIDLIDINLIAAPGFASKNVVTALEAVVAFRGDCYGYFHGPLGLDAQEIVDWHNAVGDYATGGPSPSVKVTNPGMALYWPWCEIYDPYNKQNVWVPPVGFALKVTAHNDHVGEPWFAPAGINRGRCSEALRVEYNASLGDREFMYGPGNGNAVNPIVNLPLDGICVYGQRSCQRTPSARDRINVNRLLFYSTKVLQRACRQLVFEQNDPLLWNQFLLIVQPFIQDIRARRGVEDYRIVCDDTTNPPYKRNNNEMHGYVLIIPTKTAEKIITNFALFPSGVKMDVPQIG